MKCTSCGRTLNPVDAMLGPVCGPCTRRAHQNVIEPKPIRKGDRVAWTKKNGAVMTGTVRYEPHPEDDRVTVACDQATTVAGGVPIGRVEHPRQADVRRI